MDLNYLKMKNHLPSLGRKEANTIQFCYRKCETHAPLFSQTLANGNSQNEIRQRNRRRLEGRRSIEDINRPKNEKEVLAA